jgi:hypothetical protein
MPKSPNEIVGKTIASAVIIRAEWARTYDRYLCLTFTDGTKKLIGVTGWDLHDPKPSIEEMKKAPDYFSPEDIAARVLADEKESRRRASDIERRERAEFERLQERYGRKA